MERSDESRQAAGGGQGAAARVIGQLARKAAAGSYGVVAVRGPRWYDGLLARLGLGTSGVRVSLQPKLRVSLYLALAPGVPVKQVVGNVESAVRYFVQREIGRPLDEVAIYLGGVRVAPADGGGSSGTVDGS